MGNLKTFWTKNRGLITALLVTLIFVASNTFALSKDFYYLLLLPLAGLAVLLFVLRFETGLMVMAMLTPLAVNMTLLPGMQLSMPVEPMMILCSAVFLFRLLAARRYNGYRIDRRLLLHPVTLLLMASIGWMVVTSCTSQLPWVSVKYTLARVWFVTPFFFAAAMIFSSTTRVRQFFWAYGIGLIIVVLISTLKTVGNFSDLQTLHRVMKPFYNDHTAYGCAIALFLPAAFYFIFSRNSKGWMRLLSFALFGLLLVGLLFSYCRAAWLSVLAAVAVYVAVRMGMKVKWMMLLFGLFVGAFFVYQGDVLYKLGKNKQDSSYDLADQVKSISNISTDASNLERLNRWASALRMWKERPVFGTGPGTYQFLYASYQRSYQLSTISTNAGDLGNAHSEYIGPLTEQGVPGVALVVALFMTTFATGVRVYRTARDRSVANMTLAFTLSLLTYYVHGVFNNFLDTDKLSVPFWAFTAVVVAMDVRLRIEKQEDTSIEPSTPKPVRQPKTGLTAVALLFFCLAGVGSLWAQNVESPTQPWRIDLPAQFDSQARQTANLWPYPAVAAVPDSGAMLVAEGLKYLGTPYKYGAKGPKAFDCAGFARYVYLKFGHTLPSYSGGQYHAGHRVTDSRQLRAGDLVFFGGRRHTGTVGHTGIVTEADSTSGTFRFVHAATHGGVIVSRSTEPYYAKRYIGACRIFVDPENH
ncbi:MAG: O-antigen ligase family protein [Bacteroidales bacterium]|nr:O-antigen ligase family protein [Bacteroidales bacterium]